MSNDSWYFFMILWKACASVFYMVFSYASCTVNGKWLGIMHAVNEGRTLFRAPKEFFLGKASHSCCSRSVDKKANECSAWPRSSLPVYIILYFEALLICGCTVRGTILYRFLSLSLSNYLPPWDLKLCRDSFSAEWLQHRILQFKGGLRVIDWNSVF